MLAWGLPGLILDLWYIYPGDNPGDDEFQIAPVETEDGSFQLEYGQQGAQAKFVFCWRLHVWLRLLVR